MQQNGEIVDVPTFGYAAQKQEKMGIFGLPPPETPALLRPRGHRRSMSVPSAPPNLSSLLAPPPLGPPPVNVGSTTRATTGAAPEQVMIQVTRIDGGFGLTLNAWNRVTVIKKDSAALFGGVQLFDRVTHIDGLKLEGKMSEAVRGRDTVELTIERPPKCLYGAIAAKENNPGATSPLSLRTPGLVPGPLPSSPLGPKTPPADALDSSPPAPLPAAVAAAAAAESAGSGSRCPADDVSPSSSPTRRSCHRRNASEPIRFSPLSAAAVHTIQSHPFWKGTPSAAAPSAAAPSAAAPSAAAPSAVPAAAAPAESSTKRPSGASSDGSELSPRGIDASPKELSPCPARETQKKTGEAGNGGAVKRGSWWGGKARKGEVTKGKSKENSIPTAVPLMAFGAEADDVESC